MLFYPNAKINIGLNIIEKRPDGFHNLQSIFYPIPLCDIMEITPTKGEFEFSTTGINIDCNNIEENLVVKAFKLIKEKYNIPNIRMHLHKQIPFGAGLGGGSADAAYTAKALLELFELSLSENELKDMVSCLGSDCSFFIENKPAYVTGTGSLIEPYSIELKNLYLYLVYPGFKISTPKAYKGIAPSNPSFDLRNINKIPVEKWEGTIKNDFEKHLFGEYPILKEIKEEMYKNGAVYASMSGSGSAMYGLFREKPEFFIKKNTSSTNSPYFQRIFKLI